MGEDDWEALYEKELEEEAKEREIKAAAKVASSVAKKTDIQHSALSSAASKRAALLNNEDYSAPLEDPIEERKRQERLVLEQDSKLFSTLLDVEITNELLDMPIPRQQPKIAKIAGVGLGNANSVDSISLKNISDCKKFVEAIGPKIDTSAAKSTAWLEFMSGLLSHVVPKMEEKDLTTLKNKLVKMTTEQVTTKRISAQNKFKAEKSVQINDVKAEMDLFYGPGEDDCDEDDYDYDEDGFM